MKYHRLTVLVYANVKRKGYFHFAHVTVVMLVAMRNGGLKGNGETKPRAMGIARGSKICAPSQPSLCQKWKCHKSQPSAKFPTPTTNRS